MKGGFNMKKKNFNKSTLTLAVIWTIFTFGAWYIKMDLGTVATLGGIALMFVLMYESMNIKD